MGKRVEVLGRLEALPAIVELEGARVTASPFSVKDLQQCTGHDDGFLGRDATTPVPEFLEKDDRDAVENDLLRRLDYTHFSILFDSRKKQALLTIVDIDGPSWTGITRRKGDVWYPDPRVSVEDQPAAKHFSKPDPRIDARKNHFAFGHLVRRLDPCWSSPGREDEASDAELQTFFLTNASPQAEDLNEGIWNDLEDLVLNDLTQRLKVRAVVMTGPLFDDKRRLMIHGEMPVPSQYFKIVAWRSKGRLATAGWVQKQPDGVMPPLAESVLPFEEDKPRRPSLMWLKPISEIGAMAKLDLSTYEAGDTYGLRRAQVRAESVLALSGPFARTAEELLLTRILPIDDVDERSQWAVASSDGEAQDDAERWPDQGEEDATREAAAAPTFGLESTGVAWAPDDRCPDYSHLSGSIGGVGALFSLTVADLEWLARANAFPADRTGNIVLFGLRGAMIVSDHTGPGGITLRDLRPDHNTARCVLGLWDSAASSLAVFPGSTVPNAAAVRHWRATHDSGNLLPTGFYGYVVGTHNGKPGCFLLRETVAKKRKVVVRRSSDDLTYDLADLADPCTPGDNIHPTFRGTLASFSSVGCQTVVGSATPAGAHSGHWAQFRKAAGLPKPDGTAFSYMLLTGAESRTASDFRRAGRADDVESVRTLRRLRFGSVGPRVEALQRRLGMATADGEFGPATAMRLHDWQRGFPGARGSDAIYTPALDRALGWNVLAT